MEILVVKTFDKRLLTQIDLFAAHISQKIASARVKSDVSGRYGTESAAILVHFKWQMS